MKVVDLSRVSHGIPEEVTQIEENKDQPFDEEYKENIENIDNSNINSSNLNNLNNSNSNGNSKINGSQILNNNSNSNNLIQIIQNQEEDINNYNYSKNNQNTKALNTNSPEKGLSKKYKNFPSNKEREYLNYFNAVDTSVKDKEIKYIRFIGKELLTVSEIDKIVKNRISEHDNNLMIRKKLDINRHQFETDFEKCCVDRNNQYLIKPTFDFNQNDKFFKSRHYLNVFLKNMTKALINRRADQRLSKLKTMITENNIKTKYDFKKYVENDCLDNFNKENVSSDSGIPRLRFMQPDSIGRSQVYLASDFNMESLKQPIEHLNNINLEELPEFSFLERSDLEVIGHKGINIY